MCIHTHVCVGVCVCVYAMHTSRCASEVAAGVSRPVCHVRGLGPHPGHSRALWYLQPADGIHVDCSKGAHMHFLIFIHMYIYIYMNIHVYVYMSLYIHGLLRVLRVGRARALGFQDNPSSGGVLACPYIYTYIYTRTCVHKNLFFCLHLRSRLRFSQHRQSPRPQYLHALGSRRCCAPVGPYIKTKHDI